MHVGLGFRETFTEPAVTPTVFVPGQGSACSWFTIPLTPAEVEATKVVTGNATHYTGCRLDWVKLAAVGGAAVFGLILLMRR